MGYVILMKDVQHDMTEQKLAAYDSSSLTSTAAIATIMIRCKQMVCTRNLLIG